MQNRRDQIQAHSFVVGRMISALLRAEPDAPKTPLRRFSVGVIWGILLGALGIVGFGIFGVFSPGGAKSWQEAGVLIVEKETGNRYVYIDGLLRPVLNYTSARLILGREPTVVRVSRNSLAGVSHGLAVGIVGAPDYLPDASRLDARVWRVCSTTRPDTSGAPRPYVHVHIGRSMSGLAHPAAAGEAFVVRTPAGQPYLVWQNQRLLLGSSSALVALGYSAVPQYDVGWSWVNALPAGPDVTAPDVPDRGTAGPSVGGQPRRVGQLFHVTGAAGASTQHFVLRPDGLSPLSPLGAALMMADPRTRAAYPDETVASVELSPDALASAQRSVVSSVNPGLPAEAPEVLELAPGEVPCLSIDLTADGPSVQAGADVGPPVTDDEPGDGDPARADRVEVEGGTGLLLRDLPAPDVPDGAVYLLVDNGIRYPVPDGQALGVLGYGGVAPLAVPAPILALVPAGSPLDPQAAHTTIPGALSEVMPGDA